MRIRLELPLTANEIARAMGAFTKVDDNIKFSFITTDSREALSKDLFFALDGERISGENFVDDAKKRGAFCISSLSRDADFTVHNTEEALLALASYYKTKLINLKYTLAITGSVGKTTAKEFSAAVLSRKYKVHKTYQNYNNLLGTALSVLTAPIDTEILILEFGMNHLGEIKLLSDMLRPDLALITNIGCCHIGNLGSREMIARAKLEILSGMSNERLLAPYGEPLLEKPRKYSFSIDSLDADYYLKSSDGNCELFFSGKSILTFKTSYKASHHLKALLCALAFSHILKLNADELISGIKIAETIELRQRLIKFNGFTVFDDTYSSSPEAVEADFEFLNLHFPDKPKSCVLGDMLELGTKTQEMHKRIGVIAVKHGARKIYAFGAYAYLIKEGALNAGMPAASIRIFTEAAPHEAIAKALIKNVKQGEIVLIKASHALCACKILDEIRRIEKEYD